jgi:ankyrin repeat protein
MKKHSYAFLLFSCFVFLCAAPDCVTSKGRSIDHELAIAVDKCDEQKVKALLKQGANVNVRDDRGRTPLINAVSLLYWDAEREALPILHVWLSRGANVNIQDRFGVTALMRAASLDSPRVVKLLLDKGAKVNLKDDEGQTALMKAAYHVGEGTTYASPATIRPLLDYGADINAQNNMGETALIMAAQLESYVGAAQFLGDRDSAAAVKVLLARGAKAHIRTRNGNTALKWAKAKGHTKTIKLLRNAGATN